MQWRQVLCVVPLLQKAKIKEEKEAGYIIKTTAKAIAGGMCTWIVMWVDSNARERVEA